MRHRLDPTVPSLSPSAAVRKGVTSRGRRILNRTTLLATTLMMASCVLPREGVHGLELTWSFPELDPNFDPTAQAQGDPASEPREDALLRTCTGMGIKTMRVEISDTADDSGERSRSFEYPCERGTPDVLVASEEGTGDDGSEPIDGLSHDEVFIELAAGTYRLKIQALDHARRVVGEDVHDEVKVGGGLKPLHWTMPPASLPFSINFTGMLEKCRVLGLRLLYSDPEAAVVDASAELDAATYRPDLVSERDPAVRLDATVFDCGSLSAGLHAFGHIDPGSYVLEVALNDEVCTLPPFTAELGGHELTLDLSQRPC